MRNMIMNIKTFRGDLFEIKYDGTIDNLKSQIMKYNSEYNYNFIRLFYVDSNDENDENKELLEDEQLSKEINELFLVMSVDIEAGLECYRRHREKYDIELFCHPSHLPQKKGIEYYTELLYFPAQRIFVDINNDAYDDLESVIEQNINYPETQKQVLKDIINEKWKFYKNKYNL